MKSFTLCCILAILLVGMMGQHEANGENIFKRIETALRHAADDIGHVADEAAHDVAHVAKEGADDVAHVAVKTADDTAHVAKIAVKDVAKGVKIAFKKVNPIVKEIEPYAGIIGTGIAIGALAA